MRVPNYESQSSSLIIVMNLRTNMIRAFESSDMNDVLKIWLEASIMAHGFVGKEFWESRVNDVRETYIPASDTYVFLENGTVKGFFSLHGDSLVAMFVSPDAQSKGIGQQLLNEAKSLRRRLNLTVYRENERSIQFYRKCGFTSIQERTDEHTGHIEILMEYCS
jgi:putative acetyltransferase